MIKEFSPIPENFFGESGLTATSANHIANLLKLRYDTLENELGSLNFTSEKMQIIGSDVEHPVKESFIASPEIIKTKLDEIARCKGFIAFLREAIKAKGELMAEIESFESDRPEHPVAPTPERPITEQDVINSMSIGDRVTYLSVEARAATFGKFIHPGGHLSNLRQRAFDAFNEPEKVAMAGRDTVIIKRANAVSVGEIDNLLMSLQAEHRKSEAQLNGLKHEIELKVKKDAQDKLDAYRVAKAEYDKAVDAYHRKCDDIDANDKQLRIDRRKVIEELKIIIPYQYKDLFNEVNK